MAISIAQLPLQFAFTEESRFESFLCQSNTVAVVDHLQHILQSPGVLSWIWGVEGAGKSHLLQAVCQSHRDALYLPMQKLLVYGSECLISLHDASFLVIDDLDLICGHREWEDQLFALLLQLLARDGRLLCSAKMPPAQLGFSLKDLQSRLQLALVYEVQPLSEAGRSAMLVERAAKRGIELKDDVVQFILARHPRSVHDLMSVLDRLDSQALAEHRRITIPFVKATMDW